MKTISVIASREFKNLWKTPFVYVILFIFFLTLGLVFYANLVVAVSQKYAPPIHTIVAPMTVLLILITPFFTMRSIANEYESGTIELLLTSPIEEWKLIIGKWMGIFLFYLCIVFLTLLYPIILNQLVDPHLDYGIILSNYFGMVLLVAGLCALGVFVSTVFRNSGLSFVTTLGFLALVWMISNFSQSVGEKSYLFAFFLDVEKHITAYFYRGVINIRDVVYFLTMTVVFLSAGMKTIRMRRLR